ncbi:hypothetical protein Pst134EA_011270 [Puccinia striiformis f. sp. tritici]|nr:hypothetical protein Pst134EA_011270 [Puccinia striiformis f. sp. tritici]KAH9462675.1 hypothetical protein Pst134EB_006558 [Puccinia striiformis f. sp. tritici]KAH9467632.1 hypothetical protein Pst134EA_011270 [Puccinia striiformis f. sp. tritici]KAI9628395.1 hypothetical protein KEM48_011678 [Puccinia striiformis f. sp. tritici PST-130]KAI9628716.1 hypothetical protein KEM48_011398 [Puccinia striiformis f. sp. tritici PST-130]
MSGPDYSYPGRDVILSIEYSIRMRDPNEPNQLADRLQFDSLRGCSVAFNTETTGFESFKARVINRIAKRHEKAAEFMKDDMDGSDAALCWAIRIANHEVALFRRFILLPTSDAGLFAQWCWSLAASKEGQPILFIGHRPHQEDPNIASPSPTTSGEHGSLSQREKLEGFFHFCDLDDVVVSSFLWPICVEQHLDRYQHFSSSVVIQTLQSPRYAVPSGILATLQDNVPIYAAYLQARTK